MESKVEINKARQLGFCFGVRRAIEILEAAACESKKIATLGPVVHNRLVVEKLAELGIEVVDNLDQVRDKVIAITTHGVSPKVLAEVQARQLQIIDTTCPIVRKAQRAARRLAEAGFSVIIFGEAAHPEVEGLLGWAGDKAIAILDGNAITAFKELPRRLGILSQTTQNQSRFAEFISKVTSIVLPYVHEVRIVNTICEATAKRQEAAVELARKSELMIVVGGYNSANTQRLNEACSTIVETHLVETLDEIDKSWLTGKHHIGITAGASTPDYAIEEVISKLKSLAGD